MSLFSIFVPSKFAFMYVAILLMKIVIFSDIFIDLIEKNTLKLLLLLLFMNELCNAKFNSEKETKLYLIDSNQNKRGRIF